MPRPSAIWLLFLSTLGLLWPTTPGWPAVASAARPASEPIGAIAIAQGDKKPDKNSDAAERAPKDITIRNVTKATVRYTIKPLGADAKRMEKSLKPDQIDRYPGSAALDIMFDREGKEINYRLDPGTPHSFRLNNDGKLELYKGSHGRTDVPDLAPWVPTPMLVVDKMLEMAQVTKDDVLFDLGCGDGRIVIAAAQKFGARGVGVDIDPQRIKESKAAAKEAGVEKLVEFRLEDALKVDFTSATVLGLYLLTESNELLRPTMEKQLKPGSRVITHDYPVPGWKAEKTESVTDKAGKVHRLYLYVR